jgi:hypothetical protein
LSELSKERATGDPLRSERTTISYRRAKLRPKPPPDRTTASLLMLSLAHLIARRND